MRLIHTKMKTSATEFSNMETQAELIAQIKKMFASANVTAEEFPRLAIDRILSNIKRLPYHSMFFLLGCCQSFR